MNNQVIVRSSGILDDDGNMIHSGHILRSAYGIPIVGIKAFVEYKDGEFIVHTPDHNPKTATLDLFMESLINVWIDGWYLDNEHEKLMEKIWT